MFVASKLLQCNRFEIPVEFFTAYSREALFQDENNLYIMMEFVQGGEMFSHLRKQEKFDEDMAKFYAVEVAVALDKLHMLGIAYRDLKPENIMIGKY